MNTATVLQALQASQLVDNDTLRADERAQVLRTLADLSERGLQAYVVVLPQSEELQDWYKLWPLLKLREGSALLLLYNGRRWEARGWGLPADAIGRELSRAALARQHGLGAGLSTALTALATLAAARTLTDHLPSAQEARTRRALASEGASSLRLWLGGGAIVLLGGLSWFVLRRQRLQQQQSRTFTEAREAAEAAFTQVMLVDGSMDEPIRELQRQALRHKQSLDTLIASVQQGQRLATDPVLLGDMTQMLKQFTTLHAAVLRRHKGWETC